VLDELWTRAETLVRDALAGLCDDVARHPGEFTEDDLRDLITRKRAVRIGLLDLENPRVTGKNSGTIAVNFGVYVIAADRGHADRSQAALQIVERLLFETLPHAAMGENAAAINPQTLDAQNLMDAQIDRKGVAMWAVSFQVQAKR